MAVWLKWAYVYQSLQVDDFATFEDAIDAAWSAREAGFEALDSIEGPDGIVASEVVEAEMDLRGEAEADAARSRSPVYKYCVMLATPDRRDTAVFNWYLTKADADVEARQLRDVYGDRVTISSA